MYMRKKKRLVIPSPSWGFKFSKVVKNEFCIANFDLKKMSFDFKFKIY